MKFHPRFLFVAWISAALMMLIGCAALQSPDRLPPLTQAGRIFVQDDWNGYMSYAPLGAKFILQRLTDKYAGTAYFAVGGNLGKTFTAAEKVEIPVEVANQFLGLLEKVSLAEPGYAIPTPAPDDYPAKSIRLELEKGTVTFSTKSSGGGWVITITTTDDIRGRVYTIRTTLPDQAIEMLDPYLKRDVQRKLIDQANQSAR